MRRTRLVAHGLAAAFAVLALPAQAEAPAISYPSVARPAASAPVRPAVTVRAERVVIERPRVSTEPAHSVFVYEALGATPRVRIPMPGRTLAERTADVALAERH
jgi:hypothetical protein